MTIGTVIRTLRASAGLQQKELAARVGISASLLSLLERDKREPTVRVLRDIGTTLDIPPSVLVAAALRSDQPVTSAEGAKVEESIEHLVRAANHYVLSARLDRASEARASRISGSSPTSDAEAPRNEQDNDG